MIALPKSPLSHLQCKAFHLNGVQTGLKCKPNVKRCKRFVFAAHSPLLHPNTLTTKAISHFQADHILTRFVFPPLNSLRFQIENILTPDIQELFEDPDFYIIEELTQKIEKAILNLPESYRIAFEMHRFQNKTYQEIAEELHISSKTVDYRIQQALKQLRKELKDYLPLLLFFFAP